VVVLGWLGRKEGRKGNTDVHRKKGIFTDKKGKNAGFDALR
jgi:hypothetical protein